MVKQMKAAAASFIGRQGRKKITADFGLEHTVVVSYIVLKYALQSFLEKSL